MDATSIEQCYLNGDGRVTWAHASLAALRDKGDAQPLVIALLADITERKQVNEQLEYAATHDALTGLPNRKLFLERLESRLQANNGAALGVLFADVDNFKFINDNFGHVVGDEVLRIVAARMAASSPNCTVARLGGDEFAIILNGEQAGGALRIVRGPSFERFAAAAGRRRADDSCYREHWRRARGRHSRNRRRPLTRGRRRNVCRESRRASTGGVFRPALARRHHTPHGTRQGTGRRPAARGVPAPVSTDRPAYDGAHRRLRGALALGASASWLAQAG